MQHLKLVSVQDLADPVSAANKQATAQPMRELTRSAQIKDLVDLAAVLSNQAPAQTPKRKRRPNN